MNYYIMQQMMWIVKPNEETDPDYLKVYDKIFIGEDVAEYCLNMAAKTNEEIGAIVNSIKNQDLKDNVADTLNQIKEMYPDSAITTILILDDDVCTIVYDFIIKASVIDKITE
nr:MAG TPA: hypothetical protein [Caudoviricetes sp.]